MLVYSVGVRKIRALAFGLLVLVIGVAALSVRSALRDDVTVFANEAQIRFDGIQNEEDLLGFIHSLGIQVKSPPIKNVEVTLPRVFDAVYSKYNDIQKSQGLDLSKYRGKSLRRYTYEITNYPIPDNTDATVYLTLFVRKNKIVAGDISSRDLGGFAKPFITFPPDLPG